MAYSAETFTNNEQPTVAKWNKLWANDASFHNASGIDDRVIIERHIDFGAIRSHHLNIESGTAFLESDVGLSGNDTHHDILFSTLFEAEYDGQCDVSAMCYAGGVSGGNPDTVDAITNISISIYRSEDGGTYTNMTPELNYVVMLDGDYPKYIHARFVDDIEQGKTYRYKMVAWSSVGIGNAIGGGNTFLEWEVKRSN